MPYRRRRRGIPQTGFTDKSIHYYLGEPYRLHVSGADAPPKVVLDGRNIFLQVRGTANKEKNREVMHRWYNARLKERAVPLVAKWEGIIGVKAEEVRTKHMLTRWGTCNITKKRIWLNMELIKKQEKLLEYVVVHELVHLLEKRHNRIFYGYMDSFLPDWKELKKELNTFNL